MTNILSIYLLSLLIVKCAAIWNFHELMHKCVPFSQHQVIEKKKCVIKELKENCDENLLLLQLARLYATSPERIIGLVCTESVSKTCQELADVLQSINNTVSDCKPLQPGNLYMKLNNALAYVYAYLCRINVNARSYLMKYHECLVELHEDLMDCEGPPDWFEKSSEAVVCQYYSEIISCNYVKAAMLCGLEPALLLRSFSDEIMKRIVKFKCKISRSLPRVDDPMPARACHIKCHMNFILYIYTLHIFHHYVHMSINLFYF